MDLIRIMGFPLLAAVAGTMFAAGFAVPCASPGPDFPGLSRVMTLGDRGETSAAILDLAAFVRATEQPADFGQLAKKNPRADVPREEGVLKHRFVVVGIRHVFGPVVGTPS